MSDAVVAHEEYVKGPSIAVAAIVYTFYKQVWPKPVYPYDVFPLLIAGR